MDDFIIGYKRGCFIVANFRLLYQYAHPEAFNDITEGNNEACSSADETTLWGFPAAAGWDPVTGLGYDSSIFSKVAQLTRNIADLQTLPLLKRF